MGQMGTYKRTVCDRCGKEIRYDGWTSFVKGFRMFEVTSILNGNPDGYSYTERSIELCRECATGLKRYLHIVKDGET